MSKVARLVGLGLAGLGVAHFAKPEVFEPLVEPAFPTNTREHIYVNGAIETAVGLGLIVTPTRKFAAVGLLGYVGYLGFNVVNNRSA